MGYGIRSAGSHRDPISPCVDLGGIRNSEHFGGLPSVASGIRIDHGVTT
jgi:hypothetical protein